MFLYKVAYTCNAHICTVNLPTVGIGCAPFKTIGGETIEKRKIFAILVPVLVVLATAFAITFAVSSAVTPAAATSPMGNITIMLDDFMPAFMQIMIVMVFVMLLLTVVSKIGQKV